jgi:hypothetical protein
MPSLSAHALPSPQLQIVQLFVFFDDSFERAVKNVAISGLQQQKGGHDAGESAVSILKRVDSGQNFAACYANRDS